MTDIDIQYIDGEIVAKFDETKYDVYCYYLSSGNTEIKISVGATSLPNTISYCAYVVYEKGTTTVVKSNVITDTKTEKTLPWVQLNGNIIKSGNNAYCNIKYKCETENKSGSISKGKELKLDCTPDQVTIIDFFDNVATINQGGKWVQTFEKKIYVMDETLKGWIDDDYPIGVHSVDVGNLNFNFGINTNTYKGLFAKVKCPDNTLKYVLGNTEFKMEGDYKISYYHMANPTDQIQNESVVKLGKSVSIPEVEEKPKVEIPKIGDKLKIRFYIGVNSQTYFKVTGLGTYHLKYSVDGIPQTSNINHLAEGSEKNWFGEKISWTVVETGETGESKISIMIEQFAINHDIDAEYKIEETRNIEGKDYKTPGEKQKLKGTGRYVPNIMTEKLVLKRDGDPIEYEVDMTEKGTALVYVVMNKFFFKPKADTKLSIHYTNNMNKIITKEIDQNGGEQTFTDYKSDAYYEYEYKLSQSYYASRGLVGGSQKTSGMSKKQEDEEKAKKEAEATTEVLKHLTKSRVPRKTRKPSRVSREDKGLVHSVTSEEPHHIKIEISPGYKICIVGHDDVTLSKPFDCQTGIEKYKLNETWKTITYAVNKEKDGSLIPTQFGGTINVKQSISAKPMISIDPRLNDIKDVNIEIAQRGLMTTVKFTDIPNDVELLEGKNKLKNGESKNLTNMNFKNITMRKIGQNDTILDWVNKNNLKTGKLIEQVKISDPMQTVVSATTSVTTSAIVTPLKVEPIRASNFIRVSGLPNGHKVIFMDDKGAKTEVYNDGQYEFDVSKINSELQWILNNNTDDLKDKGRVKYNILSEHEEIIKKVFTYKQMGITTLNIIVPIDYNISVDQFVINSKDGTKINIKTDSFQGTGKELLINDIVGSKLKILIFYKNSIRIGEHDVDIDPMFDMNLKMEIKDDNIKIVNLPENYYVLFVVNYKGDDSLVKYDGKGDNRAIPGMKNFFIIREIKDQRGNTIKEVVKAGEMVNDNIVYKNVSDINLDEYVDIDEVLKTILSSKDAPIIDITSTTGPPTTDASTRDAVSHDDNLKDLKIESKNYNKISVENLPANYKVLVYNTENKPINTTINSDGEYEITEHMVRCAIQYEVTDIPIVTSWSKDVPVMIDHTTKFKDYKIYGIHYDDVGKKSIFYVDKIEKDYSLKYENGGTKGEIISDDTSQLVELDGKIDKLDLTLYYKSLPAYPETTFPIMRRLNVSNITSDNLGYTSASIDCVAGAKYEVMQYDINSNKTSEKMVGDRINFNHAMLFRITESKNKRDFSRVNYAYIRDDIELDDNVHDFHIFPNFSNIPNKSGRITSSQCDTMYILINNAKVKSTREPGKITLEIERMRQVNIELHVQGCGSDFKEELKFSNDKCKKILWCQQGGDIRLSFNISMTVPMNITKFVNHLTDDNLDMFPTSFYDVKQLKDLKSKLGNFVANEDPLKLSYKSLTYVIKNLPKMNADDMIVVLQVANNSFILETKMLLDNVKLNFKLANGSNIELVKATVDRNAKTYTFNVTDIEKFVGSKYTMGFKHGELDLISASKHVPEIKVPPKIVSKTPRSTGKIPLLQHNGVLSGIPTCKVMENEFVWTFKGLQNGDIVNIKYDNGVNDEVKNYECQDEKIKIPRPNETRNFHAFIFTYNGQIIKKDPHEVFIAPHNVEDTPINYNYGKIIYAPLDVPKYITMTQYYLLKLLSSALKMVMRINMGVGAASINLGTMMNTTISGLCYYSEIGEKSANKIELFRPEIYHTYNIILDEAHLYDNESFIVLDMQYNFVLGTKGKGKGKGKSDVNNFKILSDIIGEMGFRGYIKQILNEINDDVNTLFKVTVTKKGDISINIPIVKNENLGINVLDKKIQNTTMDYDTGKLSFDVKLPNCDVIDDPNDPSKKYNMYEYAIMYMNKKVPFYYNSSNKYNVDLNYKLSEQNEYIDNLRLVCIGYGDTIRHPLLLSEEIKVENKVESGHKFERKTPASSNTIYGPGFSTYLFDNKTIQFDNNKNVEIFYLHNTSLKGVLFFSKLGYKGNVDYTYKDESGNNNSSTLTLVVKQFEKPTIKYSFDDSRGYKTFSVNLSDVSAHFQYYVEYMDGWGKYQQIIESGDNEINCNRDLDINSIKVFAIHNRVIESYPFEWDSTQPYKNMLQPLYFDMYGKKLSKYAFLCGSNKEYNFVVNNEGTVTATLYNGKKDTKYEFYYIKGVPSGTTGWKHFGTSTAKNDGEQITATTEKLDHGNHTFAINKSESGAAPTSICNEIIFVSGQPIFNNLIKISNNILYFKYKIGNNRAKRTATVYQDNKEVYKKSLSYEEKSGFFFIPFIDANTKIVIEELTDFGTLKCESTSLAELPPSTGKSSMLKYNATYSGDGYLLDNIKCNFIKIMQDDKIVCLSTPSVTYDTSTTPPKKIVNLPIDVFPGNYRIQIYRRGTGAQRGKTVVEHALLTVENNEVKGVELKYDDENEELEYNINTEESITCRIFDTDITNIHYSSGKNEKCKLDSGKEYLMLISYKDKTLKQKLYIDSKLPIYSEKVKAINTNYGTVTIDYDDNSNYTYSVLTGGFKTTLSSSPTILSGYYTGNQSYIFYYKSKITNFEKQKELTLFVNDLPKHKIRRLYTGVDVIYENDKIGSTLTGTYPMILPDGGSYTDNFQATVDGYNFKSQDLVLRPNDETKAKTTDGPQVVKLSNDLNSITVDYQPRGTPMYLVCLGTSGNCTGDRRLIREDKAAQIKVDNLFPGTYEAYLVDFGDAGNMRVTQLGDITKGIEIEHYKLTEVSEKGKKTLTYEFNKKCAVSKFTKSAISRSNTSIRTIELLEKDGIKQDVKFDYVVTLPNGLNSTNQKYHGVFMVNPATEHKIAANMTRSMGKIHINAPIISADYKYTYKVTPINPGDADEVTGTLTKTTDIAIKSDLYKAELKCEITATHNADPSLSNVCFSQNIVVYFRQFQVNANISIITDAKGRKVGADVSVLSPENDLEYAVYITQGTTRIAGSKAIKLATDTLQFTKLLPGTWDVNVEITDTKEKKPPTPQIVSKAGLIKIDEIILPTTINKVVPGSAGMTVIINKIQPDVKYAVLYKLESETVFNSLVVPDTSYGVMIQDIPTGKYQLKVLAGGTEESSVIDYIYVKPPIVTVRDGSCSFIAEYDSEPGVKYECVFNAPKKTTIDITSSDGKATIYTYGGGEHKFNIRATYLKESIVTGELKHTPKTCDISISDVKITTDYTFTLGRCSPDWTHAIYWYTGITPPTKPLKLILPTDTNMKIVLPFTVGKQNLIIRATSPSGAATREIVLNNIIGGKALARTALKAPKITFDTTVANKLSFTVNGLEDGYNYNVKIDGTSFDENFTKDAVKPDYQNNLDNLKDGKYKITLEYKDNSAPPSIEYAPYEVVVKRPDMPAKPTPQVEYTDVGKVTLYYEALPGFKNTITYGDKSAPKSQELDRTQKSTQLDISAPSDIRVKYEHLTNAAIEYTELLCKVDPTPDPDFQFSRIDDDVTKLAYNYDDKYKYTVSLGKWDGANYVAHAPAHVEQENGTYHVTGLCGWYKATLTMEHKKDVPAIRSKITRELEIQVVGVPPSNLAVIYEDYKMILRFTKGSSEMKLYAFFLPYVGGVRGIRKREKLTSSPQVFTLAEKEYDVKLVYDDLDDNPQDVVVKRVRMTRTGKRIKAEPETKEREPEKQEEEEKQEEYEPTPQISFVDTAERVINKAVIEQNKNTEMLFKVMGERVRIEKGESHTETPLNVIKEKVFDFVAEKIKVPRNKINDYNFASYYKEFITKYNTHLLHKADLGNIYRAYESLKEYIVGKK